MNNSVFINNDQDKNYNINNNAQQINTPDIEICIATSDQDIEEYKKNCENVFSEDYGYIVEKEDYKSKNVIIIIAKYKDKVIAGQRIVFPKNSTDLLPIEKYGANLLKINTDIKNYKYAEIGKLFVLNEFRGSACNKLLHSKTLEIALKHRVRYLVWMLRFVNDSYGTKFDEPYIKVMPKGTIKLHMQYVDLNAMQ